MPEIQLFDKGIHNLLPAESIPQAALSDAKGWVTQDGRLMLSYGRDYEGGVGMVGAIYGDIFGYKNDGTKIHWRKAGTKIQYLNGDTWTDVITGLTETADYAFSNYSSLAGTFTFAFGADGIYKMHNANPDSYISLYDAAKNFKGKAFIDRGRSILWDRPNDKTGIYGSWIDRQDANVYTSVSGEATASGGGTLAFKSGGATRNCFNLQITLTGTGEVYTDNYDGTLTGNMGGTGTINYITGVYTLSNTGTGTANYQWENSNAEGVTDFTKSATRLAGEGFQFPQDEGGDAILNVLIGQDGNYYSMKSQSVYQLALSDDDTTASNIVYRRNLGIPSYRGAVSTGKGIVFMNTANPEKPEMTILEKNALGDAIEPKILFAQFRFSDYVYDDCAFGTWDRYIVVACKSRNAVNNDTILLCNPQGKLAENTVDVIPYEVRTFSQNNGILYGGSSVSMSTYKLFNGFDDLGNVIENHAITKQESFGTNRLKKIRKLRFKGRISRNQAVKVYMSFDDSGFQLVGTIVGNQSYVDIDNASLVGGSMVGVVEIGGNNTENIYDYYMEIRLKKLPKFRLRAIKLVATKVGYFDVDNLEDWDVLLYGERIPSRFRQKQNVSLDGETTDVANPEF